MTRETDTDVTVWAVFFGEVEDDGEITNPFIRAIYDNREAAAEHVDAMNPSIAFDSDWHYWIESFNLRRRFDPEDEEAL